MVRCIASFLDFCYLARRPLFTEATLTQLDAALDNFHHYREVFRTSGVRLEGFSLPRQHSMKHYRPLIQLFAAPAGLCSSITESRHITAVKKPWRRSNHYKALGQMLVINQRLDKLAAARADYVERGMLPLTYSTSRPSLPNALRFPPQAGASVDDEVEEENQDIEAALSHVSLARTRGEYAVLLSNHLCGQRCIITAAYPAISSQYATFLGSWMTLRTPSISPFSPSSHGASSTTNFTQMGHSPRATSTLKHAPASPAKFPYSTLPLPPSMHRATPQECMACGESASGLRGRGVTVDLAEIALSSSKIRASRACLVSLSFACSSFSLSSTKEWSILVHSSSGSNDSVARWMMQQECGR